LSAAVVVDGAMLSIYARDRNLQPDLKGLAKLAEAIAESPLEDRLWFDATTDAELNNFHFAAKGAGYQVKVNELVERSSEVDRSITVCRRKQVGVDVSLALDTLEAHLAGTWNVLVLVACDGDFLPLLEKLRDYKVRLILLCDRAWTAKKLAQFADKVYDLSEVLGKVTRPRPPARCR
jgi:uncharacterized LabA/DUF88 family protein